MKIWLVTIGEPVPVAPGFADRLHRGGYLAHFLARAGHDVTWWTSAFDHFSKTFLKTDSETLSPLPGLKIRLLRGCGYSRNVSFKRIKDHRQVAGQFARLARESEKPDVILSSFPTIELCGEAARYGRETGVPVALDIRDLWPDIFVELAPGPLRPLGRLLLGPYFAAARRACAGADAIFGITDEYVRWGLEKAGRARGALDLAVPFGYEKKNFTAAHLEAAGASLAAKGVTPFDGMTACFFGTLGRQFEIPAVLEAAKLLKPSGKKIRFVLCGAGDNLELYRRQAAGLDNCLLPGWVNEAEIAALMRTSAVGLAPYRESDNFRWNVPNKIGEYLAGGLPIALSLRSGVARDLLQKADCCLAYDGDAAALADGLASLADDAPRLAAMKAAASALFAGGFEAGKVYGGLADGLSKLAAAGKRRA